MITPSSSRGPTVDGRTKPDIAAPGTYTASALSDDASPSLGSLGIMGDGEHEMLLGTSMSAPLTAGSVALLMQEDPTLSTDETRSLLKSTARVDGLVQGRGGDLRRREAERASRPDEPNRRVGSSWGPFVPRAGGLRPRCVRHARQRCRRASGPPVHPDPVRPCGGDVPFARVQRTR